MTSIYDDNIYPDNSFTFNQGDDSDYSELKDGTDLYELYNYQNKINPGDHSFRDNGAYEAQKKKVNYMKVTDDKLNKESQGFVKSNDYQNHVLHNPSSEHEEYKNKLIFSNELAQNSRYFVQGILIGLTIILLINFICKVRQNGKKW